MDIQKMLPFVVMLILVAMVVGVGVLIMDKFDASQYATATVVNDSFTVPVVNGTVDLGSGDMESFTSIHNSSGAAFNSTKYTVNLEKGTVFFSAVAAPCLNGSTCYADYVDRTHTATTNLVFQGNRDALSSVATDWYSIIIIVGVCAIILFLVIRAFSMRGR